MNNFKKLDLFEQRLVLAAAAVFVVCVFVWGLFGQRLLTVFDQQQEVIGEVVKMNGEVLIKQAFDHEFLSLNKGDIIRNADQIFTQKDSSVEIRLISKIAVELGSASQALLATSPEGDEVLLQKGHIEGRLNPGTVLHITSDKDRKKLHSQSHLDFEFTREVEGQLSSPTAESLQISELIVEPQGFTIQQSLTGSYSNLPTPHPVDQHHFLHQQGGEIAILPKKSCFGPCELKIYSAGQLVAKQQFTRASQPVASLKVQPGFSGQINWEFNDGDAPSKGAFHIQLNNSSNIKPLLQSKASFSVMN